MSTFKKFEDIIAWQLANELSREIQRIARNTALSKDFKLRDQILDASDSIGNNIAEGYGRSGNREFIQFLHIAQGSCMETKSQLKTVLSREYIQEEEFHSLDFLCYRVGRAISKLILYLQSSDLKGPKYRHRKQ